ncbi:MAG: hypothetical protein JWM54_2386, partial [Acidobacteriaceae bacterium]|nr:hypothetical protein [Acidobacteriaceae bacterium]
QRPIIGRDLLRYLLRMTSLRTGALAGCTMSLALIGPAATTLSLPLSAATKPALDPAYDRWLNREVNYLITSDERSVFLGLKTNQERDRFIESFWRLRNLDPTDNANTFKEEHYRRLTYVREHLGHPGQDDGWQTDRGMVYITLGPPQQRLRYPETRELKPMEVWFYQSPSSALPAHFYLVFFKMSPIEDYRLYSPYIDHPQKLVNSLNAINDDQSAIKLIQRDINDETAQISLSLIPGEPVDLKNPSPTLDSDVLLNKIRNFRNLPENREILGARRAAQESVSHRIIFGTETSSLTAVASRDSANSASIHYLMTLPQAGDFVLKRAGDGKSSYRLQVETALAAPNGGKTFLTATQELSGDFTAEQTDSLLNRPFGLEGRVPIAPGQYKLSVTLRNPVTRQSFAQERVVLVPAFNTSLGLSQVFIAVDRSPVRVASPVPFSFAGVRIAPLGGDNVAVPQGAPLRLIMQIWAPLASEGEPLKGVLNVHYLIGRLNDPLKQEEDQSLDKGTFDTSGNLLLGKDLVTKDLQPGSYRLVVKVTDPETHATAYQSLNFIIQRSTDASALWTLLVPPLKQQAR